jgi:hypothetical protein
VKLPPANHRITAMAMPMAVSIVIITRKAVAAHTRRLKAATTLRVTREGGT